MKKAFVLLILCVSTVLLSNCARKTTEAVWAGSKTAADTRVTEIKTKYNEQQINEGHVIFMNTCAKCHALPDPKTYSLRKLDKILPKMVRKAQLPGDQAAKVCAWVFTHMS
jgi:cytochrome c5